MPRALKVALIAAYPASGLLPEEDIKPSYRGTEHPAAWVRALCLGLAAHDDITYELFVHSRAVTRVCRAERDGIRATFIPKREPLRADPYHLYLPGSAALKKHVDRFQPDIIHGFGAERGHGLMAVRMGYPSVFFIQGIAEKVTPFLDRPLVYKWLQKRIERVTVRRADGIIAETGFARDWATSIRPGALVRVIPHALNPDFLQAKPSFMSREILCIGSIDRKKGCDTVLDAFIRCAPDFPDATLTFIGEGGLRSTLEQQAAESGLAERVTFTGTVDRAGIIDRMNRACMVVTGSRMDTSPNVVTEAHAAALPVVGTDVGGIPEMIDEGRDGHVVPVENDESMAEAIQKLLGSPAACRELGAAGRQKVIALNDSQSIADQHVEFYRTLIERRKATS